MSRFLIPTLFMLLYGLLMTGCSKDDTTTNPAGGGGGGSTYYGTFANSAESGSMTMHFASTPKSEPGAPANTFTIITITGSIKIQGGATITITGTFDTATDSLKISGGGYSFAGLLSGGQLTGGYTGPHGSGSFVAGTSASGSTKIYCGTYTESTPIAGANHGRFNMAIDGNAITVLTWNAADTTAGMATFKGALSGSNISIFFSGTSGAVLATGSLSGDKNSVSGSYDSGSEQGNWSGTICQ